MTSETFTQTAGQLITNALRDARIIAAEQPIQPKDIIDGLQAINMIIKHWQAQGIHLWSEIEAVLPLIPAQRKYLLGPNGDDIGTASSFFNTTLTEDIFADPDILGFNPALSTDDWGTIVATATIVNGIIQSTNTGAFTGRMFYSFTTVVDTFYEITFEYVKGTSEFATFFALSPLILTQDLVLGESQIEVITFTAGATTSQFQMDNDAVSGANNSIASVLIAAKQKIIHVASTSGNTTDGQAVAMAGAPEILSADPTKSVQDWVLINSASITADSITGLTVIDVSGDNAGVELALDTDIGVNYQLSVEFSDQGGPSIEFTIFDSTGELDRELGADTGTVILQFTARDLSTTFSAQLFGATSPGDEFIIVNLNYLDVEAGDRIGIELDDGTRHWDNIVTVDSDTQVTINNGIPNEATTGNTVYTYGTAIARPMRLLQSRFAETITASEIPVRQWSRDEYFDQPDKDSSGTVVNWYYTPTLTIGQLFVWQVANDINQVLRFTFVDPIEVPTGASDMLEVPSEWYMPLKWSIAAEMGPSRGLPDNRQIVLESKAAATLSEALAFDVERESLSFQPDFR